MYLYGQGIVQGVYMGIEHVGGFAVYFLYLRISVTVVENHFETIN